LETVHNTLITIIIQVYFRHGIQRKLHTKLRALWLLPKLVTLN